VGPSIDKSGEKETEGNSHPITLIDGGRTLSRTGKGSPVTGGVGGGGEPMCPLET